MPRKIKENNSYKYSSDENLWDFNEWNKLEEDTLEKIISSKNDDEAYSVCKELGKKILKNYSNSFFTVTRFLPKRKRDLVEIIYASVRFPDEIVDTFDMTSEEKNSMSHRKNALEKLKILMQD